MLGTYTRRGESLPAFPGLSSGTSTGLGEYTRRGEPLSVFSSEPAEASAGGTELGMSCHEFRARAVQGEETLTVTDTAAGFTAAPRSSLWAYCTVEDADIRLGASPTASSGRLHPAATDFWLSEADIRNFKFIRTGGTNAQIHATFYR